MNATEQAADVVVVGGGLVGLSTALHLSDEGLTVAIVDGPDAGRASTAAAGMLTPVCEYDPWMPLEFLDLLQAGLRYYPQFLSVGGWKPEQVGYRASEFTLLDLTEQEESLLARMDWMLAREVDCCWLEPDEVTLHEPHLSTSAFRGAIRIRGQAIVNPIALWKQMRVAVELRGIEIKPSGMTSITDRGESLLVGTKDDGKVAADRLVVAAGSWSAQIGVLAGLELPVTPVKGQMVQLAGPAGVIGSIIFMPSGGCGSIAERAPGVYVVGTSEEYLSPTACTTAGVVGSVLCRLTTVLPAAADWEIVRTWAGFRPMTSDELPIIGRTDDPRIVVATGHHRNGILLAPLTGRLASDLITGAPAPPGLDLRPFRYGRELRAHTRFASKY